MIHFVYKTTNLINNNFYYGVHSTLNLNDQYLGSGQLLQFAIAKYGRQSFKREIIQFCSTRIEAYKLEASIVTLSLIKNRKCYNKALGGCGGNLGPEAIAKMAKARKGQPAKNKGKPVSEDQKRKISKTLTGRKNPKISKALTGRRYSLETNLKKGRSGQLNKAWKGYYITPAGTFETVKAAAIANATSGSSLRRYCLNRKPGWSFQPK